MARKRKHQKMSFTDAMSMVPDDLPDGAYWAMAHEFADLDYGEGFSELEPAEPKQSKRSSKRRKAA